MTQEAREIGLIVAVVVGKPLVNPSAETESRQENWLKLIYIKMQMLQMLSEFIGR